MEQIIKENYEDNYLIKNVIKSFPYNIKINTKLINFFETIDKKYNNEQIFSVNCLFTVFEDYFEVLCWEDIKKRIPLNYQIELSEEIRKYFIDSLNNNKIDMNNLRHFVKALKKFLSRYIVSSRKEFDINQDITLFCCIIREDLWSKEIYNESDNDIGPLIELILGEYMNDIKVGACYNLFNFLDKYISNNNEK